MHSLQHCLTQVTRLGFNDLEADVDREQDANAVYHLSYHKIDVSPTKAHSNQDDEIILLSAALLWRQHKRARAHPHDAAQGPKEAKRHCNQLRIG